MSFPTLRQFWNMLRQHDWFHEMSDDHRAWTRGRRDRARISGIASQGGQLYLDLFDGYIRHVNGKGPKPEEPWDTTVEAVETFHRVTGAKRRFSPGLPEVTPLQRMQMMVLVKKLTIITNSFHTLAKEAQGKPVNDVWLRCQLIHEEFTELLEALANDDPVAVLDALTDLQYVLDGSYVTFGMHGVKDAAFKEVHNSNMTKLDDNGRPYKNPAGRVVKGPNFVPPDLARVLKEHTDDPES